MSISRREKHCTHRLLTFSTNKLIENYTHVGFKQHLTHQSFKKALLGSYSGISVINPASTLSQLRVFSRFVLRMLLANQKLCFVGLNIPQYLQKRLFFYGNFFIYGKWPSGLVTNFRKISRTDVIPRLGYFKYLPSAIILFDLDPQKSSDVIDEARSFLIPIISFTDSIVDLSLYPYWIPTNLKSGYSRVFLLSLVKSLFYKWRLAKRGKFFSRSRELVTQLLAGRAPGRVRRRFKKCLKEERIRQQIEEDKRTEALFWKKKISSWNELKKKTKKNKKLDIKTTNDSKI